MGWVKIGEGLNALFSSDAEVEGTVKEINSYSDSMELYEDKPQNLVVLLRTAGFTVLAPIISLIKGIICTSGGTSSHLAIISREYRIPCIMAARLDHDDDLDKKRVRLLLRQQRGYVYLQEAQNEQG